VTSLCVSRLDARSVTRDPPPRGPTALPTRAGLAPLESASEEQYDKYNPHCPDETRGPISIGVIAPSWQASQHERNDDNQQE
jgi:hypothetical protein